MMYNPYKYNNLINDINILIGFNSDVLGDSLDYFYAAQFENRCFR